MYYNIYIEIKEGIGGFIMINEPYDKLKQTNRRLESVISFIWENSPTIVDYAYILMDVLKFSEEEVINELTCNCGEDEERAYEIYREAKEAKGADVMKKYCVECNYKDSCKNDIDTYEYCPHFCTENLMSTDKALAPIGITLTDWEVGFVRSLLDDCFLEMIREDTEIDSMLWVYNAMQLYKKVGGLDQYDDYEGD